MYSLCYQTSELARYKIMLMKTGFETPEKAAKDFKKNVDAANITKAWIEQRIPGDIMIVKELK